MQNFGPLRAQCILSALQHYFESVEIVISKGVSFVDINKTAKSKSFRKF